MTRRDPTHPTDLIGQPIAQGDYVSFPSGGKTQSLGAGVGVIERITFKRQVSTRHSIRWKECSQGMAEKYNVYVRPLQCNCRRFYRQVEWVFPSFVGLDGKDKRYRDHGEGVKPLLFTVPENLVKINIDAVSDAFNEVPDPDGTEVM